MSKIINDEPFNVKDGIIHHEEGVDVLTGNIELSGIELSIKDLIILNDGIEKKLYGTVFRPLS